MKIVRKRKDRAAIDDLSNSRTRFLPAMIILMALVGVVGAVYYASTLSAYIYTANSNVVLPPTPPPVNTTAPPPPVPFWKIQNGTQGYTPPPPSTTNNIPQTNSTCWVGPGGEVLCS